MQSSSSPVSSKLVSQGFDTPWLGLVLGFIESNVFHKLDYESLADKTSLADVAWKNKISSQATEIKYFTKVISLDFHHLEDLVLHGDLDTFNSLVCELTGGAFLHITDAYSDQEVNLIKEKMLNLQFNTPSTFYKMDSLIPNYWRDITPEIGKKYSVPVVKKAAYFFPWNNEADLFRLINRRWRILKVLGGKKYNFGEEALPDSGVVDRIQVVQYESGSGYLPAHQDPNHNQRMFISGYLSKYGVDFTDGGFWALGKDGKPVLLEKLFKPGDMGAASARIVHGVNAIQGKAGDKRWFLGLYTNDSDTLSRRKTWGPVGAS